ncbi:hypothetical protein ACWIFB_11390 [Dietzia sp. NPDC055340]
MKATLKRVAATGATAALLAAGMGIAAGTGVANADTAATCGVSNTKTELGAAGIVGISLTKTANKAEVQPGGTVTYKVEVAKAQGVPPVLSAMRDIYPEGLTFVSAKVNGKPVDPVVDASARTVTQSGKWIIGNKPTLEVTYKASDDLKPGTVLNSGAAMYPDIWGWQTWDPIDVCVKIREKNPVEAVTGSLDSAGLGSATGSADGGSAGSQISSDPASFIADIINQINLGKLIGLS